MNRKLVTLMLVVAVVVSFVVGGCAPEAAPLPEEEAGTLPTVHWKETECNFGPGSEATASVLRVTAAVTERTGGKFTFTHYGPELGDYIEVGEMTARGDVQMNYNILGTTYDPRWNLCVTPYIFTTYEEVKEGCGPEGFLTEIMRDIALDSNIAYLGLGVEGMTGISMNIRPATTPEEAEGIKIRVPPMDIFKCYVGKLGFTPVLIPYAEVPSSIATGVVDGQAGGDPYQTYSCCRDLNEYFVWYRDFLMTEGWLVNLDAWNALPEEYQQILQEEVTKECEYRIGRTEELDLEHLRQLEDYGLTVVDLADYPEKLAAARDSARECWTLMDELVGKRWMDRVRRGIGMQVE